MLLSTVTCLPYFFIEEDRFAAAIALVCTMAMTGIAWYTASAPTQLRGVDPVRERIEERPQKIRDAGMACALACGIALVFVNVVNMTLQKVDSSERIADWAMLMVWIVLGLWQSSYWVQIARVKPKPCS